MYSVYPIHGFARPMRVYPMPGNAFAQQKEMQRLREMEARRQQASSPAGDQGSYAGSYADSPRGLGRPVSSWSFVINNNNNNNNAIQTALERNLQQPYLLPEFDPALVHSELLPFLLPENDPALDGISDLFPDIESLKLTMSERDRSAAFRQHSQSSDLMTPHRGGRNQQPRLHCDGHNFEFTMPHSPERNQSTPLRFDDQSSEFTPRRIERNQPTLVRPGDLSSESNIPRRIERNQPTLPRPSDLYSEFTMSHRTEYNQPILGRSAIQSSESESVLPRRIERNQSTLVRPDSQSSEVMMPRRTPPARYAALTSQHTAPMPAHLTTANGRTNVTAQSQYVQRATGNDAMVMSTGPMIPTRDGSYAATGMPRTVQGHQVTSMMGQLDSFSLSPSAPVFTPGVQAQFTLEQLIKRVDRLQIKQEADKQLINQLLVRQEEDRANIEQLKKEKGVGRKPSGEREIGDGWYNQL